MSLIVAKIPSLCVVAFTCLERDIVATDYISCSPRYVQSYWRPKSVTSAAVHRACRIRSRDSRWTESRRPSTLLENSLWVRLPGRLPDRLPNRLLDRSL